MNQFLREKILPITLIIGAILLFIGIIVALNVFFQMTLNFEGIASILLFVVGCAAVWFLWKEPIDSGFLKIMMIVVFAVFGALFDGAGNFIYNKPLELAFCPAESELTREVSSYETEDGTMYTHHFACFSESRNETVKQIPGWVSSALRFLEYALLGGIFLGIIQLSARFAKPKS